MPQTSFAPDRELPTDRRAMFVMNAPLGRRVIPKARRILTPCPVGDLSRPHPTIIETKSVLDVFGKGAEQCPVRRLFPLCRDPPSVDRKERRISGRRPDVRAARSAAFARIDAPEDCQRNVHRVTLHDQVSVLSFRRFGVLAFAVSAFHRVVTKNGRPSGVVMPPESRGAFFACFRRSRITAAKFAAARA